MTRGKLILIEGLDRSGKSTQSAILADKLSQLHKNRSKLLKFPDRSTPIGKIINQYLLAKLQQNATGSPEMASVDWLYSPDKGLPKPDLTLFLTLDMEELSVRKGWGEERYEKQEFQKSVKTCFLSILDPVKDKSIHFVDVNNKNIEDVTKLIWLVVESTESHFLTDSPVEKLV